MSKKIYDDLEFKNISDSAEGQLLKTAVCVICATMFPKAPPNIVLEVIKDIRKYPLIDEPYNVTLDRIIVEYQKKYN